MNRIIYFVIFSFLIGFVSSCIKEYNCEIDPKDKNSLIEDGYTSFIDPTFISQLDPTAVEEITIRNKSAEKNSYLKFNELTKIEKQVKSATIKLYTKGTPFPNKKAYSLLVSSIDEHWDEYKLNYENSPSATYISIKTFSPDTLEDKKLFEIDVTEILNYQFENELPQYGFSFALNLEDPYENAEISFYSSDVEESSLWPAIEIEYGKPEQKAFPRIYYTVIDDWDDDWGWPAAVMVNVASFSTETQTSSDSFLFEYPYNQYMAAEIGFEPGEDPLGKEDVLHYVNTQLTNDGYIHVFLNSDQDREAFTYTSDIIQNLLFVSTFGNSVYVAASSQAGDFYILEIDSKNKTTKIIYQKPASGEKIRIKDFKVISGSFYWVETEELSGKTKFIAGSSIFSQSITSEVLYEDSDFGNNFSPEKFTVDPYSQRIYFAGNSGNEKGMFYSLKLDGTGSLTELPVKSDYTDNITNLEIELDGNYLYWMNSSESETKGGIMRVKVDGTQSEVVYDKITNGYAIELAESEW